MEQPKQLSVSELRKKFESNKSSAPSTTTTSKPIQSAAPQSNINKERQAFPATSQSNGINNSQSTSSEPDTTSMSVKERMKLFSGGAKTKNESQPEPKKVQPSTSTVNNDTNDIPPVSSQPEELEPVAALEEPVEEVPEVQSVPQEVEEPQVEEVSAPIQEEKIEEIQDQVQEVQEPVQEAQEAQEEVHEEKHEEIQEQPQEVQEPVQEVQEEAQEEVQEVQEVERIEKEEEQQHQEEIPSQVEEQSIVEKEEIKTQETKNPVLNRNAGFASEMNALLGSKGLRSTEESPIKPEQSKNQGLGDSDSYTEVLLTRPTNEGRKKKANLVFVDDEDF